MKVTITVEGSGGELLTLSVDDVPFGDFNHAVDMLGKSMWWKLKALVSADTVKMVPEYLGEAE